MFQLKNPSLDSTKSDVSLKLPNLQGKVRTFKDDLGNFEKGNPRDDFFANAPTEPVTPPNPFESLPMPPPLHSETLTPLAEQKMPGRPTATNALPNNSFSKTPNQPAPTNVSSSASLEKISPDTKNSLPPGKKPKSKLLTFTLFFVVLIAIAGGAYYYWYFLKNKPAVPATSNSQSTSAPSDSASATDTQNKKLRRLVVDTTLGPAETKSAVQKFASDFSSTAAENDLVELKLLNKENNTIGKKEFISGFSLVIPDTILGKLSEDYSLFVKKESGISKLGLAFKTITSANLTGEMRNWEPGIVSNLASLFMEQAPVAGPASFNSSQYRSADIRYFNFSSPPNTSLDYSIVSNFLVIGTSRDSLRSILDYMSEK